MKVVLESEISDKVPQEIKTLLTEVAKKFEIDIWVTKSEDELDEAGYGAGV